jgi:hypothetical protein
MDLECGVCIENEGPGWRFEGKYFGAHFANRYTGFRVEQPKSLTFLVAVRWDCCIIEERYKRCYGSSCHSRLVKRWLRRYVH